MNKKFWKFPTFCQIFSIDKLWNFNFNFGCLKCKRRIKWKIEDFWDDEDLLLKKFSYFSPFLFKLQSPFFYLKISENIFLTLSVRNYEKCSRIRRKIQDFTAWWKILHFLIFWFPKTKDSQWKIANFWTAIPTKTVWDVEKFSRTKWEIQDFEDLWCYTILKIF